MHSHYYGGLVDSLRTRRARPYVALDAQGRNVLNAMTASTVMSAGYTEPQARISYLDAAGIGTQLMTFPGALGIDVMPSAEVADPIRHFNDHLAAICRDSNGRFCGLAGLPLDDMPTAVAEFRRIRIDLGLPGAILPGDFFLEIERAEQLRPLFRCADDLGGLLLVHPGLAPGGMPPEPFADTSVYRTSVLALQASISQMGMTLLFSSLLDDHPNVAVQLVNLGGTLPFVVERLEAVTRSRSLDKPFERERLRLLHYDCASLGPRALEVAVKTIGADRIMLGTDYPIFQAQDALEAIERAAISEGEKQAIRSNNAAALLSRFGWMGGERRSHAGARSEMGVV
ncbi:amidohydrolase family protein [Mesorhizobium sp. ASY16-5R]|uniref:amidohydrolase family protein n=1 Tax=Mesorhizobium sp. ASY16-5R TaxID=3445772 RepID=UPI003F9F93AA